MNKLAVVTLVTVSFCMINPALAERETAGPNEVGYVFQWPVDADIARHGEFKGCLKPNTSKWFDNNGDVLVRDEIIKLNIAEQLFQEAFADVLTADNLTVILNADVRVQPVFSQDDVGFEQTCREVFENYSSACETTPEHDTSEPSWYDMIIEERFRFLVREEVARHQAKEIPNSRGEIAAAVHCALREFLVKGPAKADGTSFDRQTLTCNVDESQGSVLPFRVAKLASTC